MGIIELIRSKTDGMTRSERCVAAYTLGHMNDIAFFTLEELAQKSDVSTTSVLRFCRRLDFIGFKEFQQAIRSDLKYSPDLLDKFHRTADNQLENTLMAQTVQQGIRCIQQTFQEISMENVEDAVKNIVKARRVYTFGMRESNALANYAYSRLLTVRGDVFLYNEGYVGNVETLLNVTEDDVFVVFLFHRYTRHTLWLLDLLKQKNIKVILITSPPTDAVARFATVLLSCCVDANGIKNSALAPICLTDYLCNSIAMENGEETLKRMKQSEELFIKSDIIEN